MARDLMAFLAEKADVSNSHNANKKAKNNENSKNELTAVGFIGRYSLSDTSIAAIEHNLVSIKGRIAAISSFSRKALWMMLSEVCEVSAVLRYNRGAWKRFEGSDLFPLDRMRSAKRSEALRAVLYVVTDGEGKAQSQTVSRNFRALKALIKKGITASEAYKIIEEVGIANMADASVTFKNQFTLGGEKGSITFLCDRKKAEALYGSMDDVEEKLAVINGDKPSREKPKQGAVHTESTTPKRKVVDFEAVDHWFDKIMMLEEEEEGVIRFRRIPDPGRRKRLEILDVKSE